jgi:transcription elongation GreA/GreB family factor
MQQMRENMFIDYDVKKSKEIVLVQPDEKDIAVEEARVLAPVGKTLTAGLTLNQ